VEILLHGFMIGLERDEGRLYGGDLCFIGGDGLTRGRDGIAECGVL